jgi:hypothetical protein
MAEHRRVTQSTMLRMKTKRLVGGYIVGKLGHNLPDLFGKQKGGRKPRDAVARIPIHL